MHGDNRTNAAKYEAKYSINITKLRKKTCLNLHCMEVSVNVNSMEIVWKYQYMLIVWKYQYMLIVQIKEL